MGPGSSREARGYVGRRPSPLLRRAHYRGCLSATWVQEVAVQVQADGGGVSAGGPCSRRSRERRRRSSWIPMPRTRRWSGPRTWRRRSTNEMRICLVVGIRACHELCGPDTLSSCAEKPIPLTDVSDEEWALVAPYRTLMTEAAPPRNYALREVFKLKAGVFEAMVHDSVAFLL